MKDEKMKTHMVGLVILGILLLLPRLISAGAHNHYSNGVEGIKGASIPGPGLYYRMYTCFYGADDAMDPDGNVQEIGLDLDAFAVAGRLTWVTPKKIMGADFFMAATIPLVYTDLSISVAGVDDDKFGLGDICIDPVGFTWHTFWCDTLVSLSAYLPTGSYDPGNPASPGKGYWTGMVTAGATFYFDREKNWSLSLLGRYEKHSKQEDRNFTPGDDFHFEWGVGKRFARIWEAGIAGYCQWQVSKDSGAHAKRPRRLDQVHAVGPEIIVFIPRLELLLSVRSLFEFGAKDRPQGNTTVVTLTWAF